MGGSRSRFPSTSLTFILKSRARDCREHLERVAAAYWKPIYYFIRRVWSKGDADAKDLTQSFLLHVLENDLIGKFDTARGNFRSYIKQCLRNFLSTEERDSERLKRGGARVLLPVDVGELQAVPVSEGSPQEDFDRDWAQEVLNRALAEVEDALRGQGKALYFDVFRNYALAPSRERPPSYREVAERHAITESDVRNYIRHVRRELRQAVLRVISEYVVAEEDILAEATRIMGEEL